ncbi:hypothetical protein CEP54_000280 [Fusarium duplospermum]|uniref:J domain-containing protein n=1 Tax=Fusarium duplospermum TaxID=1325734 RepID=A0A428R872_9HYPO|nr:hypothetical protein CEP54_000280 [Fusarium duplospermum]
MASNSSAVVRHQPPSVEDESENDGRSTKLKAVPYGSHLEVIKDGNLQDAIIAARPTIVKSWLENELSNVSQKDLLSYRDKLCTEEQMNKISAAVSHHLTVGKRRSNAALTEELCQHKTVLEFFIEYALDEGLYQLEVIPRRQREEIERILALKRNGGDDYQMLKIDREMTRSELFERRRQLVFLVHPDRNTDHQATECTQIVLNAAQRLLDSGGRTSYKPPARQSKDVNASDFENMFGPGAYLSGPDESDMSDEEKEQTPEIPEEVRKVHRHIRKYIEPGFSKFKLDADIIRGVLKGNNRIKRLNSEAKRPSDAYLVPPEVLYALTQQQKQVVDTAENHGVREAEKELSLLRQNWLNTFKKRENQWPESWADIMERAVRERLDEIGKNKIDPNQPGDPMNGGDTNQVGDPMDGLDTNQSDHSARGSSVSTTMSVTAGDDTTQPIVRPIQSLRPGYTLLGDKILGYRPLKRYNRYEEQYFTHSMKFFVETPGSNIFKIFSGSEIGYQAALAYDRLPESEKNDVGRYLEDVSNGKMDPGAFEKILSVGAKESEFEMIDRLPETWVRIAMAGDENTSKAKIIHRTALRSWVDNADKLIDSFYVDNGIEPPWAFTRFPDPRNAVRYMALKYPAPRRRALEIRDRPRLAMGSHYNEARLIGYDETGERSRLAARPYQDEPTLTASDERDNRLIHAFEQLTVAFREQREEQREYHQLLESALRPRLTGGQ